MAYRLIGTGTTDAQGVARCSNNYVGTGKGEVDFIASTDNPIVEGSLQSEPYTVWDYLQYDEAVDGKKDTHWTPNGLTVSTTSEGTTVTGDAKNYSSTIILTGDFQLEVATKGVGNYRLALYKNGASTNSNKFYNNADWIYWRIIRQGSTVTLQYSTDGTNYTDSSWTEDNIGSNDCYFTLMNLVADRSITYKNFKVWSI